MVASYALLCEPSWVLPFNSDECLVLLTAVTATAHRLQVVYRVIWYATGVGRWVDVVNSPVVTFEFFVAGNTSGLEYGLGIGSGFTPCFSVMPISHDALRSLVRLITRRGSSVS